MKIESVAFYKQTLLTFRIPVLITARPGEGTLKRGEEEEMAPSNDHIVVDRGKT